MTKEQFISKVEELLPGLNDLILERANTIANSEFINLEEFDDCYYLPKLFIAAMADELTFQYRSDRTDKRESRIVNKLFRHM